MNEYSWRKDTVFMECLDKIEGKEKLKTISETEAKLDFNNIHGSEKGKFINEFKKVYQKFGRYSKWQVNVLRVNIKQEYFGRLFQQRMLKKYARE